MGNINRGDKLPHLDHTDNRILYTYTVYRISSRIFEYVLKRHKLVDNKAIFDYRFNDFETFHKEITEQGFIPFVPHQTDAPNFVMTYL